VARLNRFIEILQQQSGSALTLAEGKPICLVRGDASRPITREALTAAQVTSLVREIAPTEMSAAIAPNAQLRFSYRAPVGAVQVTLDTPAMFMAVLLITLLGMLLYGLVLILERWLVVKDARIAACSAASPSRASPCSKPSIICLMVAEQVSLSFFWGRRTVQPSLTPTKA